MALKIRLSLLIFVLIFHYAPAQNAYQNIFVNIDVLNSSIQVEDTFELPNNVLDTNNSAFIYLNKELKIEKVKGGKLVEVRNLNEDSKDYVNKYLLTLEKSSKNSFSISYKGVIKDVIEKSAAEYARGFSETKGIISEIGIYLAGSTYWLPEFENKLLSSFDLKVEIDKDWSILSQGQRTQNEVLDNAKYIVYHSPEPMDEIYLVGGKWAEYTKTLGNVEVQAFLRTPDKGLADRYLNSTSDFLTMYETLIGKYPYTKFALVENFWETGYGMPSFTLLGEKIIRFPWILNSSYPHELLHNYWGNGVFVDYSKGNWCEGLTAYMADHLIQEQMGSGAEYRQTTLQKFTDYVNDENDMPINQFISRNNPAEESIGYGKVMMVNNMLRSDLGDEIFIKAYQKFYKDYKFTKASFPEIQKSFEEVSRKDLSSFFKQWIDRKGTPSIEILNVNSTQENNEFNLSFTLKQIQKEDVFNVSIPVAIYLNQNSEVVWKNVEMNRKEQHFRFTFNQQPLKIEVDPEFNIMRKVSRSEVPSTLSQVFGSQALTLIIPSKGEYQAAYNELANIWKTSQEAQGKTASVRLDSELEKIPADHSVWVIGFENKFNKNDLQNAYVSSFNAETIDQIKSLSKTGAVVYAVPNQNNLTESVGFVGANSEEMIKALSGKLLHYGKYGYLGFEGDTAINVLKGVLPVLNSPLNIKINDGEIKAKIVPRKALFEAKK